MKRLLVVDDEEKIREVIKEYAEFEGYEAVEACDGMEAVKLAKEEDFDLIIMDIMMPRLDGFSAVKELRKVKDVPVIMLSARTEEYDKLFGFELGADDYVVKPFSPKELMARVNAVLKRKDSSVSGIIDKVDFDGLTVDYVGRNVFINGVKVVLTPKEYDLLCYFIKNIGIALSREKLLKDVWGYDYYGDDRTVDTHVKMLRSSIGEYRKFIITLRGVGYKFEP
jgi:DNA-binding response OmpR family regulator